MKQPQEVSWEVFNQRHLAMALNRVRASLDGQGSALPADSGPPPGARPPALETLCSALGLSSFERDILLLTAGIELDSTFATLCARAAGDAQRQYPTFSLALAAFPEAHWSAVVPTGPLRYWRLVEIEAGPALTTSPLRIDECILHYLAGVPHLDERLHGVVEPVPAPKELPPSQRDLAARIVALWSAGAKGVDLIQLCGDSEVGTAGIGAAACADLGLNLHVLRVAALPPALAERETLIRLWRREAVLHGSALLLDCEGLEGSDAWRRATDFMARVDGLVLVTGRDPIRVPGKALFRLDVAKPTAAEQRALWTRVLGPWAHKLDAQIELLIGHFDLGPPEIRCAGAALLSDPGRAVLRGPELLWDACRVQARTRLDDLAQRIEPAASWDDLVLPAPELGALREIVAQVRQRLKVYDRWGFAARCSRGLGITALFVGASGTGKTLAAEVLANALHLDLYRIDLSAVVSKYIGETEKNLRRVFDAAEAGGAVLLFDEADALFGRRSEVKDSHDRYANIEVSYLLQRMEAYRGLAILTTNMKQALDVAFLRRIRFVVQFPFPPAAERAQIWRRMFPPETPTEGLAFDRLAQLGLPGGNIRNVALGAAFLAADEGSPVCMRHVLHAARTEYAKLERPLTPAEMEGWT